MRNPFCKYYAKCLDKAVKHGLQDFTCSGCEHENEKKKVSINDFFGCCLLFARLYLPKAYKEYIEDCKEHTVS